MTSKKTNSEKERQDKIVAEARQGRNQREKTYREKALKMYPWVCARCGREFATPEAVRKPAANTVNSLTVFGFDFRRVHHAGRDVDHLRSQSQRHDNPPHFWGLGGEGEEK